MMLSLSILFISLNYKTPEKTCIYTCRLTKMYMDLVSWLWYHFHFSSVTQSCPTLWDPMDCRIPGFPVHHQLPELAQTHVHSSQWCHPIISSSVIPFFSRLQSFPASGSFPVSEMASYDQSVRASASAAVLPMNIQGWFSLGLTSSISLQS